MHPLNREPRVFTLLLRSQKNSIHLLFSFQYSLLQIKWFASAHFAPVVPPALPQTHMLLCSSRPISRDSSIVQYLCLLVPFSQLQYFYNWLYGGSITLLLFDICSEPVITCFPNHSIFKAIYPFIFDSLPMTLTVGLVTDAHRANAPLLPPQGCFFTPQFLSPAATQLSKDKNLLFQG